MAFSSIPFLVFFLPVFLAAYFATPGTAAKNAVALLASLLFYAWGEPQYLALLLYAIAGNYAAALVIDRLDGGWRRAALALALAGDLLLLGRFKYAAFAGLLPAVALPLGISFYVFHCMSYLIDVQRRRLPANRNPLEIALYIALFPQLIAGPIVRYGTVARQLRRRRHRLAVASAGMRIFIIGLAQKVLLADQVAPLADTAFAGTPGTADAWLGLLAYTQQIYFDFAGYSAMAVGLGLILGFTLPRNFRLPYISRSLTEFWRRWHMSLSRWLRDYLYIPLGGNRGPRWRTWSNLVIVFLLCGLWHGAAWTFVLWGVWHGAFLAAERAGLSRLLGRLPAPLAWGYAMLAVMGGWVLFRAPDLAAAGGYFAALAGRHGGSLSFAMHMALTPLATLALAVGGVLAVVPRWPAAPAVLDTAWTVALLALTALFVAAGTYSPFLYFRF